MIIEFFGLPCVGKTTLMRSVSRLLAAEGWKPIEVDAREFAPTPLDKARCLADPSVAKWRLIDRGTFTPESVDLLLRSVALAKKPVAPGEVRLIDEGALKQATWLAGRTRRPEAFARAVHTGQAAVMVDCDPYVLLRRARKLNRKHARERTDAELLQAHTKRVAAARQLADAAGVALIEVDTTEGHGQPRQVADLVTQRVATTNQGQVRP